MIIIMMQISLASMYMRIRLIPPVLRVAPVMSSHFHTVLFYVNQRYKQREPSQPWKHKFLLQVTIAELFPVIYMTKYTGKEVGLPIG